MTSIDISDIKQIGRTKNKYGVSAPSERTARGRVYASKAEKQYADHLHSVPGLFIIEQPRVRLGEDHIYVPDFMVWRLADRTLWFIDVKGVETSEFRKSKKLWAKYMSLTAKLEIIKLKNKQFMTTELI